MNVAPLLILALTSSPIFADSVSFNAPVELADHGTVDGDYWVDVDGNGVRDRTGYDRARREVISLFRSSRAHSPYKTVSHGTVNNYLSGPWLRDVDGDGDLDFVIQDGRELVWWEARSGEGLFRREVLATVGEKEVIVIFDDLDGDGLMDLALRELRYTGRFPDSGSPRVPKIGYGNVEAGFDWVNYPALENRYVYHFSQGAIKVSAEGHRFWGDSNSGVVQLGRNLTEVNTGYHRGQFVDLDGDGVSELVTSDQVFNFSRPYKTIITEVVVYRWRPEGRQEMDRLTFPVGYQYDELLFPRVSPGEPPVIMLWSTRYYEGYGPTYRLEAGSLTGGVEAGGYGVAPDYGSFNPERSYGYYLLDDDGDGMDSVVSISYESTRDVFGNDTSIGPQSETLQHLDGWKTFESNPSRRPAVQLVHDTTGLAVRIKDGKPGLVSLGGADGRIRIWEDLRSAKEIASFAIKDFGISLQAGDWSGTGTDELAWTTSTSSRAVFEGSGFVSSGVAATSPGRSYQPSLDLRESGRFVSKVVGRADSMVTGKTILSG